MTTKATVVDAVVLLRGEAERYHPKSSRREEMSEAADAIEAQAEETARLRAALKPFAEFGKMYAKDGHTSDIPDHAALVTARMEGHAIALKIGDLRAALKALE